MARDIEDVIDHLEDALSAAEKLRGKDSNETASRTAAVDAINQIRRGDYADAITTLEREFLPKWKDVADCEVAYRMAVSVTQAMEAAQ